MADKLIKITITSAVAIGGQIKTSGTEISVPEELAKNLLGRGRAELATEGKSLSDKTVPELKAQASDLDIDGSDSMKKAELISAIEAALST